MSTHEPITNLPTHRVTNQPPALPEYNLFDQDAALRDALEREGGSWAADACRKLGAELGTHEVFGWGHDANRFPPSCARSTAMAVASTRSSSTPRTTS